MTRKIHLINSSPTNARFQKVSERFKISSDKSNIINFIIGNKPCTKDREVAYHRNFKNVLVENSLCVQRASSQRGMPLLYPWAY